MTDTNGSNGRCSIRHSSYLRPLAKRNTVSVPMPVVGSSDPYNDIISNITTRPLDRVTTKNDGINRDSCNNNVFKDVQHEASSAMAALKFEAHNDHP